MSRKLYVGNLPYQTTRAQLQEMFSKAGDIASVYLSTNRYTSKSNGFGFVEMVSEAGAQKAIELFHGYSLSDRLMTVQEMDSLKPAEWKGAATTVVFRKFPRPVPVEETPSDDATS
ncbi:MAG: RNA-binding protein [Chloroflexi bacterium]|nr:RNA-binding protein [Chloroflexota bacterium]